MRHRTWRGGMGRDCHRHGMSISMLLLAWLWDSASSRGNGSSGSLNVPTARTARSGRGEGSGGSDRATTRIWQSYRQSRGEAGRERLARFVRGLWHEQGGSHVGQVSSREATVANASAYCGDRCPRRRDGTRPERVGAKRGGAASEIRATGDVRSVERLNHEQA